MTYITYCWYGGVQTYNCWQTDCWDITESIIQAAERGEKERKDEKLREEIGKWTALNTVRIVGGKEPIFALDNLESIYELAKIIRGET